MIAWLDRLCLQRIDVLLDQILGILIPDQPQAIRCARVEALRPTPQYPLHGGVRLLLQELQLVLATVLSQSVHECLGAGRDAGEVDVADVARQRVALHVEHADEVLDDAAGRADVRLEAAVPERDDARLALHGLADHARQEGRGRVGGLAGPHHQRGEAHDEGVDEALAVHVVDDDLGRQLVGPVRALGRGRHVVGHDGR